MARRASLLLGLLLLNFFCSHASGTPGKDILARYEKANRLFNAPDPTPAMDSMALAGFQQLIVLLEQQRVADTILFQSYLKKGILLDVKGNYSGGRDAYLQALSVHQLHQSWSDSLLYALYIYVGSDYYHLNQFDSANYFLSNAEVLSRRYPLLPERERLYNVWGALYYESGNYRQSSNYFKQALEIVKSKKPFDKISAINFEINIASANYRQELYPAALGIYNRLLKHGLFTSQLYMNIGKSYAAMGKYPEALASFKKVNPEELPGVYSEIANAELERNNIDASGKALSAFAGRFLQDNTKSNSVDAGIYHLCNARLLQKKNQFSRALEALQQAIIIFSGNFHNKDIYTNPEGFAGFASWKLFEALRLKSFVFAELYQQDRSVTSLKASLAAYQSTISLLRYIEKSYDTDDARILLKKNSTVVYEAAFEVCLQLHRIFPAAGYLEQAFLIAEKNKASVIAQQLNEHRFKQIRGIDPSLLQKERVLKYQIARLKMKSDQAQRQADFELIAKEKMRVEVELSRLQHEIEKNNAYYRLKYDESYPGIWQIQQALQPAQVIISLYAAGGNLHAFVVTGNSFRYLPIDSLNVIKRLVADWTGAMQAATAGRRFTGHGAGEQLYKRLVQPVQSVSIGKNEWIIIPDDMLHFLPFESLPGSKGAPLLESTVISYQLSSQFLVPVHSKKETQADYSVLAFAPFNLTSMTVAGNTWLGRLPASAKETEGLPGKQYADKLATKAVFLQQLNRYPIVHLVTHAVADTNNSGGSFIAFYPSQNSEVEDRLYANELYGLNMDSTELVILSACETGNGKLIGSEGVMSLSRGFAYAGCASIINSLWKSDDMASSIILKQFHLYLQQGMSKAKALQKAKIDYLHSDALYKSPGYWANLVLIGDTDPVISKTSSNTAILIIGGLLLAVLVYHWLAPVLYRRIFQSRPDMPLTFS